MQRLDDVLFIETGDDNRKQWPVEGGGRHFVGFVRHARAKNVESLAVLASVFHRKIIVELATKARRHEGFVAERAEGAQCGTK
jgi:hypothetical protein